MKFYFSVRQLPEVARLSEQERLIVLSHFLLYRTSPLKFRFAEISFVAFVILAEIAGFVGGAVYWRGFWASLLGAVLAMCFVMAAYYFFDLYTTVPKLRRFLQSERGRFILEHAKKL
jgi:hypothetical protein